MSGADESRDHEPTRKKLDDARAKGDVARSNDLVAALSLAAFVAVLAAFGAPLVRHFGEAAQAMIAGAGAFAGGAAEAAQGQGAATLMARMLLPAVPLFVLPAIAALLALILQRSLVFAPDKLMPDLKRIDPFANAGRRFGRKGLFEFAKSFAKLIVTGALVLWFAVRALPEALVAAGLGGRQSGAVTVSLLAELLVFAAGTSLLFGLGDYLWEFFDHRRRNRMSQQELREEHRESEGDPHMKGARRQRAREIATNQMLADVARCDVVIVNPTHYAVALKWDRASGRAPFCLAKGTDEIAARIRERAQTAGVPIHSDPPTARLLHATVDIGAEIQREHYAAVAAAIRYVDRMRRRARERQGR